MAVDPEFEPFSDDAMAARRLMPDVIMVALRMMCVEDLADDVRTLFRERLAYLCFLAELGLVARGEVLPAGDAARAVGEVMKMAQAAFRDQDQEALASLKRAVEGLCGLAEKGLTTPQTSERIQ